jgi:hypothetical protein
MKWKEMLMMTEKKSMIEKGAKYRDKLNQLSYMK